MVLCRVSSVMGWCNSVTAGIVVIYFDTSFVSITLIFNDHIMQDYACFHDVGEVSNAPRSCRFSDDIKSCLENTKSTLDIFASRFLHFREML